MTKEETQRAIVNAAVNVDGKKKLPCAKAFEISRGHGTSLKEIGDLCNESGIKISNCQLGCFQ